MNWEPLGRPLYVTPTGKTWLCKIGLHKDTLIYPHVGLIRDFARRHEIIYGEPYIDQCKRCGRMKKLPFSPPFRPRSSTGESK